MALIVESIVLGILGGGIYALMASGLTLIFGVLEIVNVAQGIFVILGAYLSYALQQQLHLDLFVGLLVSVPFMFCVGVAVEVVLISRLKGDRVTLSVLATYAIGLVLEGVLGYAFTTNLVQLHAWYVDASIQIGNFYLPYIYLFSFALSVALIGGLFLLIYRTAFGRSLRASMQNRTAAALLGINVPRVQAITFGLGVALAAAGGMAYGATNTFNPASSYDLISRLLVIIVLGGMGSLWGALVGSVLILIIGDVTAVVWSPVWSSTAVFVLLIALLVFRPQGIFGLAEGRRQ